MRGSPSLRAVIRVIRVPTVDGVVHGFRPGWFAVIFVSVSGCRHLVPGVLSGPGPGVGMCSGRAGLLGVSNGAAVFGR
jgi:hypothetical protein